MFLKLFDSCLEFIFAKFHNIPCDSVTETSKHLQCTEPDSTLIVFHNHIEEVCNKKINKPACPCKLYGLMGLPFARSHMVFLLPWCIVQWTSFELNEAGQLSRSHTSAEQIFICAVTLFMLKGGAVIIFGADRFVILNILMSFVVLEFL